MELFTVEKLGFTTLDYEEGKENNSIRILENVNFQIRQGEFAVICGRTGCGKSTLMRLLKKEVQPNGEVEGSILYFGKDRNAYEDAKISAEIGYVGQNPNHQCVTDKVWHEMAFGLENLGIDKQTIRRRVAEMSAYFDMEDWYEKDVNQLSGGQKQILSLASVMVMQPKILLLDEPTSQLDPIAAAEFIETIGKLNREFGITILIIEHRLEEVFPYADHVLVMDHGTVVYDGNVRGILNTDCKEQIPEAIYQSLPSAMQLYRISGESEEYKVPVTVVEGKQFLAQTIKQKTDTSNLQPRKNRYQKPSTKPLFEMKDIWFRYEKHTDDILRGVNLSLYKGETVCLLGGNGSGKTTAIKTAAGILNAYTGRRYIRDKKIKGNVPEISMLPQDVETVFVADTVKQDLKLAGALEREFPFDLSPYYDRHPYDLSGGEKQIVALAKVMSKNPDILLMDEPAKGLDGEARSRLIAFIREMKKREKTILIVTHDVEFAALCADRCLFFFRGEVVAEDVAEEFFWENAFYTTAAARIAKGYLDHAVTNEQLLNAYKENGGMES